MISTCPHDSPALSLTSFCCDVWWTSELSSLRLLYLEQLPLLGTGSRARHRCHLGICFGFLLVRIDLWWPGVFSLHDGWVSSTLGNLVTGVGGMWTFGGLYKEGSCRSWSCMWGLCALLTPPACCFSSVRSEQNVLKMERQFILHP